MMIHHIMHPWLDKQCPMPYPEKVSIIALASFTNSPRQERFPRSRKKDGDKLLRLLTQCSMATKNPSAF